MEIYIYSYVKYVRGIMTGRSECGKNFFLTNLFLGNFKEYDKIYIYQTSVHQHLYQKLIECFSNYRPFHIIPIFLKEEKIDIVIDEIGNDKNFEKSDCEFETYESIEELTYLQKYGDGVIFLLDVLNEKEVIDPRVQAMFKRSRLYDLSIFNTSRDYYELPKRTIRANGKICHIFKPNFFRSVQNLSQDKLSMDMKLNEFKYLTSTCWDKKYQLPNIDMTKDKYTGRYRLRLFSKFVPDSCPFLA